MRRVITFGCDETSIEKMRRVADEYNATLIVASDKDLDQKICDIVTSAVDGQNESTFAYAFVLLEGFTIEGIRGFARRLKQTGCTFHGIRIRISAENREQILREVLQTAQEEYETACKTQLLANLVNIWKSSADIDERIEKHLEDAQKYLGGKEYTLVQSNFFCSLLAADLKNQKRMVH